MIDDVMTGQVDYYHGEARPAPPRRVRASRPRAGG